MTRALHVTCLTIAMSALGAFSAVADAKPSIAVLGLEVTSPDNGNVDQQTTAAASNLTIALRERVRAGTGPYESAPGSDKELIDLKLLNECSSEAMGCMAKIGNDLGAKFVLYGHLVNKGGSYKVAVVLLNVEGKAKSGIHTFEIPLADLSGGPKGKDTLVWARRIYGEMTGETSSGNVVVRLAGADHGTVLIEENGQWQPKGSITSGQGKVVLPEGNYKIAIESEGFQRYEGHITVTAGGDTQVSATMAPMSSGNGTGSAVGNGSDTYGGTISEGPNDGWHKVFIGSAVVTGVMAVGFGFTIGELSSTGSQTGGGFGGKCISGQTDSFACNNGHLLSHATYVTGFGGLAFLGLTAVAFIESRRTSSSNPNEHAGAGHRVHRTFAVTPVVSPTQAGAAFQIDF
jgi:hypothetical protein